MTMTGFNLKKDKNNTTSYGTGTLGSDANLHTATLRRHVNMKWGILAVICTAGVWLVTMGLFHGTSNPSSPSSPTTGIPSMLKRVVPLEEEQNTLSCYETKTLNDIENQLMQSVHGLVWKKNNMSTTGTLQSFIQVDTSKKYQQILGFGGAFTEAAALQFHKLSKKKQDQFLNLYFNQETGSGYTFGRIPMGSCDFSLSSYNFDDIVNDTSLHHFDTNVQHDTKYLIPFIKRAMEKNPQIKFFLAPWSPPSWMKQADPKQNYIPSMLGSAYPIGLNQEFRQTWALYFSKFISAYKNHGIHFWGLTPQNEPEFAAPWEACAYNPSYQAEFIANFLGPIMKKDHPEIKIMVFDHNRGSIRQWAETMLKNPKAQEYIDGIAFHWYDNERIMDGVNYHERLNDTYHILKSYSKTNSKKSNRFILATESCNCPGIAKGKDAWFRGQRYAHDIITDLNQHVVGWVDWNLILDHTGGPNHLGNKCDAPIVLNEQENDFFIQPMYYFIQHFSRFVPPGSIRIFSEPQIVFQKKGQPNLFVQYPVGLYHCDQSSRQQLQWTQDHKIQITNTSFCIENVQEKWQGPRVELVECIYTSKNWTFHEHDEENLTRMSFEMNGKCLALNHGAIEHGTRLTMEECDSKALHQKWFFQKGQMFSSLSSTSKCVTAGYAFVQTVAFLTPENKKVLVVLNENSEDAHFSIKMENTHVETLIPKNGIRTFTWK